jgi:hypothetical protein
MLGLGDRFPTEKQLVLETPYSHRKVLPCVTDRVFSSLHVRRSPFQKPPEQSYSTSELVEIISK